MRAALAIPPAPDRLRAPHCSANAIAARERFVRAAAEAWARAGDTSARASLLASADALANRFKAFRAAAARNR